MECPLLFEVHEDRIDPLRLASRVRQDVVKVKYFKDGQRQTLVLTEVSTRCVNGKFFDGNRLTSNPSSQPGNVGHFGGDLVLEFEYFSLVGRLNHLHVEKGCVNVCLDTL